MKKIDLFTKLGQRLGSLMEEEKALVAKARIENPWFTDRWVAEAASNWSSSLSEEHVTQWLGSYALKSQKGKIVGIIMAGNLPFVGLHDLLSVIACDATAICKLSSSDSALMIWVIQTLIDLDPEMKNNLQITDYKLNQIDALIATGSDNSSRYFEYYFKDIPKLIRKNRSSVAIVDPEVTSEQLALLSHDIFSYFGLGCRNVGKVYLPEGYDVTKMIDAFEGFKDHIHHHKYANNYTYHKAILLMNLDTHLDNGFLILQQKDTEIKPPLSVLFYSFYTNKKQLVSEFANSDQIQCIVGDMEGLVPYGEAQKPSINDYADHIDTIQFVLDIATN